MKKTTLIRFTESIGILNECIEKENRIIHNGVTGRQLLVLAGITSANGPLTLGEAASLCGGSYQSIKTVIIRLETLGFAELRRDDIDRRKYLICTTEQGEALGKKVIAHLARAERKFAQHLSEEEMDAFIKVVDTIQCCGGYLEDFKF